MAMNEMTNDSGSRRAPKHHIRNMTDNDVQQVLKIWGENGLHEGTHTIQSFLKVDPNGFIVAVDDESGEILGMCAGVFVNPDTAFIGLYAVSPKYQKLGIGIRMWRQIMTHIGDRNAGLYAVPEHLVMYRDRAGFTHEDNKLLYIYESDTVRTVDLVKNIRGTRIKRIDVSLIPQIIEYDTQVHGYSRAKLLPHVFSEGDTISLAAIDEYDNKVVGYGSFRTNNISNGFGLFNPYSVEDNYNFILILDKAMAGPLYANNDAVAELIVYEIIKAFPIAENNGLLYMTLDSNPGSIRIAEKLGLHKHEELPRFFSKKVFDDALWNRVYCIHSPNFALF